MLLSCAGVFFAVKFSVDATGTKGSKGIVFGLLAGCLMLLVEMVLFVIRATREEKMQRQHAKFLEEQSLHNIAYVPQPQRQKPDSNKASSIMMKKEK